MRYWAEGAKARNSLRIVNSDPELLAVFVAFLREHFHVPNARLKICCTCSLITSPGNGRSRTSG